MQCGKTKKFIAEQLAVHPSTITRETQRNEAKKSGYYPKKAQEQANIRKERFAKERKFDRRMESFLEEKIRQ